MIKSFHNEFKQHNIIQSQSFIEEKENFCIECMIIDYHHANVFVGMHGAGMTNMIFMPKGSLIIEIVGEFTDVNMPLCGYYGTLAAVMGHHHYLYAIDWKDSCHMNMDLCFDPSIPAKEAYQFYQDIHNHNSTR